MSKWRNTIWTKASPEQMVNRMKLELSATPKWRIFKRMHLKDNIKFWGGQK